VHGTAKKWFLLLSFLLWFAVYNGVRFSSESWSGAFFTIGFAYFFRIEKHTLRSLVGIGICFGISFLCRYQSALLFGGLLLWILVMRKSWRMPIFISIGVLFMMALGFVLDHWLYGEWICTLWNYFDQNLLQGKASSFGVDPWYKYIIEPMMESIPTVGIVLFAALIFAMIKKYKEAMLWCMVPFIGVHLLIGHKETRFLFPLIGLAPLAVAQLVDYLQGLQHTPRRLNVISRFVGILFWVTNMVFLLVILFKPADNHIALYECLYNEPSEPMVLNYIKHNPYHRVENVMFYKRSDMTLNEITDVDQIEMGTTSVQYVATKDPQFVIPNELGATLIFETYPSWIYRFNYNNWLKRSGNWRVYRLN
jgi:phosphatidylinositol glycan class B